MFLRLLFRDQRSSNHKRYMQIMAMVQLMFSQMWLTVAIGKYTFFFLISSTERQAVRNYQVPVMGKSSLQRARRRNTPLIVRCLNGLKGKEQHESHSPSDNEDVLLHSKEPCLYLLLEDYLRTYSIFMPLLLVFLTEFVHRCFHQPFS